MFVPPEFTGLWRRSILVLPDGSTDTTTEVLWLQTRSMFADIRVPATRPKQAGDGFAAYTDADLAALAAMQGFGGVLEVEADICRWRRRYDYQPPGGPPDEAGYTIEGDLLIETGLHADYREDWVRETAPDALLAAFTLGDDTMLVVAGDHFIEIRNRNVALPEADSLADLVKQDLASGARDRAEARMDLRIAYGRVAPIDGVPWQITRSTLPWLEGKSLFTVTLPLAQWRLEDTNREEADLAPLFA
jgi:hypothetical protein